MKMEESLAVAPLRADCVRRRLAESEVLTVDVCGCGVMQLHLGAMTLRMTPGAVTELIETLTRAVDAHSELHEADGASRHAVRAPGPRGQA